MKLYLGELKPILEGLKVILSKQFDNAETAYCLGVAQAEIIVKFQPYEQARVMLVQKYARKDDDGNFIKISTPEGTSYDVENAEAFSVEHNDLAQQEVEIAYDPIPVSGLRGIKGVIGDDIAKLGRLIKRDEVEAVPPLSVVKPES